jgi:serine/threonine protein kinase
MGLAAEGGGLLSAKICDWGLAERILDPHATYELDGYGISAWEAPETLRHRQVSRASDVYSLASTLLPLWTSDGRSPWADVVGDRSGLAQAVLHRLEQSTEHKRPYALSSFHEHEWATIPVQLQDLLLRCTAYNWGDCDPSAPLHLRPSCSQIVAELERMLQDISEGCTEIQPEVESVC